MKISAGKIFLNWFLRIFMLLCLLLVLFPVVWLLLSSFKNQMEFMSSPMSLPEVWRFENYIRAWSGMNLSQNFLNSLLLVVGTAVLYFVMLSTTSYILAKYRFRLKGAMRMCYFVAMMIPAVLMLTPMYYLFDSIGWTDNLVVLMVIYAVISLPASVFMVSGFMAQINDAFLEAARLDGANEFHIFTKIVIPMVKPVLLFSVIGNIMGTWNEYTIALTFISSPEKHPVSIGLHFMENSVGDKGVVFAGLVIALLPVLVLYGVFQKQIQEGVSADEGVKG